MKLINMKNEEIYIVKIIATNSDEMLWRKRRKTNNEKDKKRKEKQMKERKMTVKRKKLKRK